MSRKLIVFTGLPGTGKSTLAEALGKQLSIPVFAKDWLEATLIRCELIPSNQEKPLGSAGYELLTVLAECQLMLEQSVILDSVAGTVSIRETWKDISKQYNAQWIVIECVCTDESLHRSKLASRQRKIPGWHEPQWADIEKAKGYYAPWVGERLVLNLVDAFEENFAKALAYCE